MKRQARSTARQTRTDDLGDPLRPGQGVPPTPDPKEPGKGPSRARNRHVRGRTVTYLRRNPASVLPSRDLSGLEEFVLNAFKVNGSVTIAQISMFFPTKAVRRARKYLRKRGLLVPNGKRHGVLIAAPNARV